MRSVGKFLVALSALPVAACALCLGAVFLMGVFGEPSRDAGLVPLVGFAVTLVPAGIGLFGVLFGLLMCRAGTPPDGRYVRLGMTWYPVPVSGDRDRTH